MCIRDSQSANEPYIRFVVNNIETNEIVAGRYAAHYDIRVASNVTPFYDCLLYTSRCV